MEQLPRTCRVSCSAQLLLFSPGSLCEEGAYVTAFVISNHQCLPGALETLNEWMETQVQSRTNSLMPFVGFHFSLPSAGQSKVRLWILCGAGW